MKVRLSKVTGSLSDDEIRELHTIEDFKDLVEEFDEELIVLKSGREAEHDLEVII